MSPCVDQEHGDLHLSLILDFGSKVTWSQGGVLQHALQHALEHALQHALAIWGLSQFLAVSGSVENDVAKAVQRTNKAARLRQFSCHTRLLQLQHHGLMQHQTL